MSARNRPQEFQAALEPGPRSLGWTIARVPFLPSKVWPQILRLRVLGEMNGIAFRTSLFPEAAQQSFYILVNRRMLEGAGVCIGDTVRFRIEPDLQPRPAELPEELAVLLDEEDGLRAFYDDLSEYMRREIGKWVLGVKSQEAQSHRAQQMAERLMLTMEGERELPPILEAAFRKRPKARAGWRRMTPNQRRTGLMAVFYYQTPEARARRVDKLLDEAEAHSA